LVSCICLLGWSELESKQEKEEIEKPVTGGVSLLVTIDFYFLMICCW
jgi:hypothetical protein